MAARLVDSFLFSTSPHEAKCLFWLELAEALEKDG